MQEAKRIYEQLEDLHDKHPPASFDEIAAEAPRCDKCGAAMEFDGYRKWGIHGLEGDRQLERAYDVCPNCTGETVFPLAQKLKLRADHWSEVAARVAIRQRLLEKMCFSATTFKI